MANETLLSKVPVPGDHVHRIRGEEPDPRKAAGDYEEVLRRFFRPKPGEIPELDFILLGMGADGHTASLFPGTEALEERQRLVAANWVPGLNAYRLTMTLPLLNNARYVLFLVTGEEKAETLRKVLEEKTDEGLPAGRIRPGRGRCLWLVDRFAARLLKDSFTTETQRAQRFFG
jgi:6-phosphogluconolactonase